MIAQDQSKVFHRRSNRTMPMAVGGEGVYLIGANGKRYLDASAGGAGINTLGYSHPKVIDAMQRQLETLPFIHGALFTTEPLEELAALLVDQAPAGLDRAFFVSGGTEGIEIALLLELYLLRCRRRRRATGAVRSDAQSIGQDFPQLSISSSAHQ
jgi:adenosylmethionine-8-amino-7-oxononanoate aminotransferase